MITLLELKQLRQESAELITTSLRGIRALVDTRAETKEQYALQEKELKRLKNQLKKAKEAKSLYQLVYLYLESGIDTGNIKAQRNVLLVKLATIEDRLKIEGMDRSTKNPEAKSDIAKFDTKYGTKKLKQQLKVLNFILK